MRLVAEVERAVQNPASIALLNELTANDISYGMSLSEVL